MTPAARSALGRAVTATALLLTVAACAHDTPQSSAPPKSPARTTTSAPAPPIPAGPPP